MHKIQWGDLTPEQFLTEYWQKKPLLIKNAFPDFKDPISADELAGLAMEEHLESRIISQPKQNCWQVAHGPFQSFEQFGEENWTLLVQAVNNWSPETHALLTCVDFLPSWRIDDVMVSFSTPNGGVGAHLDQYDVFIIQGEGKRRWQVGAPDKRLETLIPHEDLKQVSAFTPIIDEITESGDLLYIPPNHPHNGISIEHSLNYSIGFQAPNNQELFSAFADKLIDENAAENRFSDANRQITSQTEVLQPLDIAQLKSFMLAQLTNDDTFNEFIACTLTQCHHPLEILIPVTPFTEQQIAELMCDDEAFFIPVSGIKSLITTDDTQSSIFRQLYIHGEAFPLDISNQEFGQLLAQKNILSHQILKNAAACLKNVTLLTSVINKGFWFIE